MEKIDRLGWAAGVCRKAYGMRIGLRTNNPAMVARLQERLPPDGEASEPPFVDLLMSFRHGGDSRKPGLRNYTLVYLGAMRIARTLDVEEALDALENILQLTVAEHSPQRVFVHAGVVGWRGKALLLPGRSCAGKTTLVAALLKAGATYFSDEYAVVDDNGLVHPYARRLSLRGGDGKWLERRRAADLGGAPAAGPLPVGLVAALKYLPDAPWKPRSLSAGKAMLELLDHTVAARTYPERVMATLNTVVPQTRTLKGWRGEAAATAELLLRQMET